MNKKQIANSVGRNAGKNVGAAIKEVSRCGTIRHISFFLIHKNRLVSLNNFLVNELGYKWSKKHNAIVVNGCGMDMVFATLYGLYNHLKGSRKWDCTRMASNNYIL